MPASTSACLALARGFEDLGFLVVVFVDRHDDHLRGGQARRQDEPLIVAVHHDNRPDKARGKAPGRGPAELQGAFAVEIADGEGLGEILAEIVRSARLQRFAVAHHGLDGVGLVGAGETLGRGLAAGDDRDRRFIHGEVGVDVEHLARFGFGFIERGVGGVALLPVKFQRAQKEFGTQFPAHHAVPLVDEHRQVAIGLNPLGVSVADDGFGRRTDHQRLFKLFAAADGDYGEFGRKAGDVRLLFFNEAFRNQKRKRGVHVAGGLEAFVERLLNVFPQRPPVRANDHAAAHRRVIGEFSLQDELVIPFREVFGARG